MSQKKKFMIALVVIWAAIFVASYFMSTRIEGPRNIDTGFQRLDVLARYQMIAFAVAIVSAIAGILWRRDSRRIMLIGLTPILVTILAIAALVGGTMIFNPRLTPEEAYQPPKTAAPAVDHTTPTQD